MTESQLQDAIRLALGSDPDLVLWRNNVGSAERRGHHIKFGVGGPGGADLIGIFRGRFVAAEIKTPTGRQTEDQRRFQSLVSARRGEYVILRSVDDAIGWLSDLRRRYA